MLDDPLHIPNLTSYVLLHLHSTTRDSELSPLPVLAELRVSAPVLSFFEKLHIDILREIMSYLAARTILSLRSTSKNLHSSIQVDQLFWRDQIVSGGLLSWLWDLDSASCHAKDAEMSGKPEQWDWKRLAKMLARESVVERAIARSDDVREARYGEGARTEWREGEMVDLPKGLANRCRIVKIVEDLRKLEMIEKQRVNKGT
jgi:F-box domain